MSAPQYKIHHVIQLQPLELLNGTGDIDTVHQERLPHPLGRVQ